MDTPARAQIRIENFTYVSDLSDIFAIWELVARTMENRNCYLIVNWERLRKDTIRAL